MESLTFEMEYYREIDKGFDFYAPQTFQDESGRRLLFAWIETRMLTTRQTNTDGPMP